jgi:hypothetical protein
MCFALASLSLLCVEADEREIGSNFFLNVFGG